MLWKPGNLLALALLLWVANSLAADIQVQVDRSPVRLDESFQIVFSASDEPDADPDFSPLYKDFDIRNQGHNSQISIINGQYNRSMQWTLTAMAKRAGDLTIPSIAFGKDRSPAVSLRVEAGSTANSVAPADNSELFIEVEAEPKNPYVQAQVLYTVRILRQVNLHNARLEEPKLDNAVLERLTEDKPYNAQRNGQNYSVIERRFAIFPQQSGRLIIQPPVLEAEVASNHSLFNRFFVQPGGDAVRLRGKAIELEVRPIPPQFSGKHWLPAKSLSLSETLSKDPPQIASGEPLTRTLTLKAQASTVGNLPELTPAAIAGLQAYPDQPALNEERTPNGLHASREEKIALIPAQPGNYTLPEIAIPWWDTQNDKEEIARIPARSLTASAASASLQATPPPALAEPAPAVTVTQIETPGLAAPAAAEPPWLWIGVAAFCTLGWLLTALAWWQSRRPTGLANAASTTPAEASEREARRSLRQACLANDASAARVTLLAWGKAHWPQSPPRHLDELAARANPDLAQAIADLNQARYAAAGSQWSGSALMHALDKLSSAAPKRRDDGLEPLYRAGGA